jgi:hypothetical protein
MNCGGGGRGRDLYTFVGTTYSIHHRAVLAQLYLPFQIKFTTPFAARYRTEDIMHCLQVIMSPNRYTIHPVKFYSVKLQYLLRHPTLDICFL